MSGERILIAEDSVVSRHLLSTALKKWGFEVIVTPDGERAQEELLKPDAPRLAVLDWIMPGKDGVEVCQHVRSKKKELYTYIILLTAKADKKDVIDGLNAGADDYLPKPFNAQELKVRLRVGIRIIELQDQLIAAREALRQQATHDPLTGLLNRAAVMEYLEKELARGFRERKAVSVIMADLDRFKRVNDLYGHLAGDAVLKEMANRMRRSLRPYDAVGRFGGEEFLVVLPSADGLAARQVAERLRTEIKTEPVLTPNRSIAVTMSLGVAPWFPDQPRDAMQLIHSADSALYDAKEQGRDRVHVHGEPETSADRSLQMAKRLLG